MSKLSKVKLPHVLLVLMLIVSIIYCADEVISTAETLSQHYYDSMIYDLDDYALSVDTAGIFTVITAFDSMGTIEWIWSSNPCIDLTIMDAGRWNVRWKSSFDRDHESLYELTNGVTIPLWMTNGYDIN